MIDKNSVFGNLRLCELKTAEDLIREFWRLKNIAIKMIKANNFKELKTFTKECIKWRIQRNSLATKNQALIYNGFRLIDLEI